MKERFIWVDYAKTIGIFLVVFAHTPLWTPVQNYIYVFHMPLFFFLSGYLFSFKRHNKYLPFLRHRFRQLLVPYLFFSVVTYIFWYFLARNFGADSNEDLVWYKPLIGIFYGIGRSPWLVHNIPLWFLPCLFVVENLYYLLFKNSKRRYLLILCFGTIGYLDYQFNQFHFWWSFNTALVGLVFYAVGHNLKSSVAVLLSVRSGGLLIVSVISAAVVWWVSAENGRINMHISYYNSYLCFLVGGGIGILLMIVISALLQRLSLANKVAEFISNNTLIILGLHLMALSLTKAVSYFVLGLPLEIYEETVLLNLLLSISSIGLLVPAIVLLNRILPFLVGKKHYKSMFKV